MHHTSSPPRRPSVLHIFKIYYPDLFGGTLTVIRDICASLKDTFASAVLTCSQSADRREIIVNDVPVQRVRSFGNVMSLPAAPAYPWRLWQKIAEHDLLALHAPFPLADLVFALGFGRNRPLVVHWHADIVTHAGLRWFIEPLMRRTLRRAKAIIVSDSFWSTNHRCCGNSRTNAMSCRSASTPVSMTGRRSSRTTSTIAAASCSPAAGSCPTRATTY